ncbi:MAG: hypothetical protein AAFZ15_19985 [Bacteroidota bacterium]
MIFIYEKGTNEFVGFATRVLDNGKYREATIEELFPDRDHSKLGSVVVKDHIKYSLAPNDWQFKLNDKGVPVGIVRKPQPPKLSMTTTAKDEDGDGMPELTADGKSKATINISIKNTRGNLHKKETTILLRTTGGALSARRVVTKTGKAKVTLTASTQTVTAQVTASAEGMVDTSLTFEFMPV